MALRVLEDLAAAQVVAVAGGASGVRVKLFAARDAVGGRLDPGRELDRRFDAGEARGHRLDDAHQGVDLLRLQNVLPGGHGACGKAVRDNRVEIIVAGRRAGGRRFVLEPALR